MILRVIVLQRVMMRMSREMSEEKVKDIIAPMLYCFGGEDGGVCFIKFREFLVNTLEKSESGDDEASEIIHRVQGVSNLISYISEH